MHSSMGYQCGLVPKSKKKRYDFLPKLKDKVKKKYIDCYNTYHKIKKGFKKYKKTGKNQGKLCYQFLLN